MSDAVENTCDFDVGMVVLRSMSFVHTPPSVSMPRDSGVTSRSTTSETSPARIPPWIAAPTATTSSGFTLRFGCFPKIASTLACTAGTRVDPPTRITSSICPGWSPASFRACWHGAAVRSTSGWTRDSNFARVSEMFRCLGPD